MKTDPSLMFAEQEFEQRIQLKVSVLSEWVVIERAGSGSLYSPPDLVYQRVGQIKALRWSLCMSL